jgi:alpha-mannosidase
MPQKPILYVVVNNHFDLTWRRCWQRPFEFHGQSFVSYTDLEEYYLLDNIALAQQHPEYKFEAESVQVARQFLARHPEHLATLQQLAREGRFAVTGGGEAIVDANMILGESLVRNYVDGLLWVEATFGQKTRLALRNDAFGNSAQLPQVLRGCEIAWATGMSYSPAFGRYWRGLDGSTILHRSLPVADHSGGVVKYPPCADCAGTGKAGGGACPACAGRGISATLKAYLPDPIDPQAFSEMGAALLLSAPEEMLPNPALLDWARQMSETYAVRFALEEDVLAHIQPWLDQVDSPAEEELHPAVELNPNNSGCLVTRIKTKQVVRRQEHALLNAETLSVMAALQGQAYPTQWLKRIRQDQYFTQFHDAITATHIDAAYQELVDIWDAIDRESAAVRDAALNCLTHPTANGGTVALINPAGQPFSGVCSATIAAPTNATLVDAQGTPVPVLSRQFSGEMLTLEFAARDLPPFTACQYHIAPGNLQSEVLQPLIEPVIENERFRISADEFGLVEIFDKHLQRAIAIRDGLRPGELLLEHDEGSPWATLHHDHTRTPLADCTHLCAAEKNEAVQRLVFSIDARREMGFAGQCLNAQVTVSLTAGIERVEFSVHADWEAFNHRLRVAFPVPTQPENDVKHIYEIPYGMLQRAPYTPSYRWAGANGDWPAIHWAGVEQPGLSVALFNQGTPSYRIEAGPKASEVILLSLLRSPAVPTYLHEPYFYSMTDYDGMRDPGAHDFAFAIGAYTQPFAQSSVVLDGEAYHTRAVVVQGSAELPTLPHIQTGPARIAAVKWAEAQPGVVLRLVEFRGQGGEVTLQVPPAFPTVAKTNLLERQDEVLPIQDGTLRLTLRPWEIATLRFTL